MKIENEPATVVARSKVLVDAWRKLLPATMSPIVANTTDATLPTPLLTPASVSLEVVVVNGDACIQRTAEVPNVSTDVEMQVAAEDVVSAEVCPIKLIN